MALTQIYLLQEDKGTGSSSFQVFNLFLRTGIFTET